MLFLTHCFVLVLLSPLSFFYSFKSNIERCFEYLLKPQSLYTNASQHLPPAVPLCVVPVLEGTLKIISDNVFVSYFQLGKTDLTTDQQEAQDG